MCVPQLNVVRGLNPHPAAAAPTNTGGSDYLLTVDLDTRGSSCCDCVHTTVHAGGGGTDRSTSLTCAPSAPLPSRRFCVAL